MDKLFELLSHISGYIYPNEIELHWGILVVVYPYVTGLVAGAFILASLEKVFNIKEVQPTYRLSLLTALSFLLVAPLPLQAHLGHPERAFEIFLTPHFKSAMAMFGFVYAWYLTVVLLLEIWFDYRKDIVLWSKTSGMFKKYLYKIISLGSNNLSSEAISFDKKAVYAITIIGIPSAFLLHGYVGFIFGSIKANPWWSSVLMPIVFLFSAMVSGIAMIMLLYSISVYLKKQNINAACLKKLASFLFYMLIVDFSLELLDFIHRIYESEESIKIITRMIYSKLFFSLVILQVVIGTIFPLIMLAIALFENISDKIKKMVFLLAAFLVQIGIFTTRWNVVIGGQLFSKSFRGLTVFKLELLGIEGLLTAIFFLILPFIILYLLVKLLPPWEQESIIAK